MCGFTVIVPEYANRDRVAVGGDFAAVAVAMLPRPRLDCRRRSALNISVSLGAMMRDTASVPPPGGAGTIQRIGCVGQAWLGLAEAASAAHAGTPDLNARKHVARRNALVHRFMCLPRTVPGRRAGILYLERRGAAD
jgi:hypothetical protein